MRRKTKRLLKAEEQFKTAVTTYILSLGARPGRFRDYEMDTPAGLLDITVYGDWIACRFDDSARAITVTKACGYPCNPYSGKWNFHFFGDTVESLDPEIAVLSISFYFNRLLNWEAVAA